MPSDVTREESRVVFSANFSDDWFNARPRNPWPRLHRLPSESTRRQGLHPDTHPGHDEESPAASRRILTCLCPRCLMWLIWRRTISESVIRCRRGESPAGGLNPIPREEIGEKPRDPIAIPYPSAPGLLRARWPALLERLLYGPPLSNNHPSPLVVLM